VKLEVRLEDASFHIEVPEEMMNESAGFFDKMDRDMSQGWQMGMEYIERPNQLQRCQIAADKLLTALETENRPLAQLMAGYILSRLPDVSAVSPDITGEIQNTEFDRG